MWFPGARGRPARPKPSAEQLALRRAWARWTDVVALFALRRAARRRINPQGYEALRQALLETCRRCAERDPGPDGELYERSASLVRPWLTLRSFAQADREILLDLLVRCQEVGRRLGAGRSRAGRPTGAPGMFAALGLGTVLGVFVLTSDLNMDQIRFWVRDLERLGGLAFRRSSDVQKFTVLGGLILLYAIYHASRTRSS